jgi:hypothetical protein
MHLTGTLVAKEALICARLGIALRLTCGAL